MVELRTDSLREKDVVNYLEDREVTGIIAMKEDGGRNEPAVKGWPNTGNQRTWQQ